MRNPFRVFSLFIRLAFLLTGGFLFAGTASAQTQGQFDGVYFGTFTGAFDDGEFAVYVFAGGAQGEMAVVIWYDSFDEEGDSFVVPIEPDGNFSFALFPSEPNSDTVTGQFTESGVSGTICCVQPGSFQGTKSPADGPLFDLGGLFNGFLMGGGTSDGEMIQISGLIFAVIDATGRGFMLPTATILDSVGNFLEQGVDGGSFQLAPNGTLSTVLLSGTAFMGDFGEFPGSGTGTWSFSDPGESVSGEWAMGRSGPLPTPRPSIPPPAPLASAVLPDVDQSGNAEALVFGSQAGVGQAVVNDSQSNNSLSIVDFSDSLTPIDAAVTSDTNNNGYPGIAALLLDESDDEPKIEIRDPATGSLLKNINYNKGHNPIAVALLSDQNSNQSHEGAVLASQISQNNRPRVLIRDLQSKVKIINISLPKIFTAMGIVGADDFSGNGAAEVLVLATRNSDGKGFVLIWDTGGAGKVVNVQVPKQHTPISHDYLTGPGGAPAVTTLSLRTSDNKGRLLLHNALTATKLWGATLNAGRTPVKVAGFQAASGAIRVAVLQLRESDQRPIVSVFNGNTGAVVENVFYDAGQEPVDLVIFPDLSSDPNLQPELGVLIEGESELAFKLRDSTTGDLVSTVSVP
jgi:hypothetical protein